MEAPSNWKRDVLLLPLAVGIILAVAAYFLPKLFEKGKRISYTIDGPTAYVNPNAVGTVKITVSGVETLNIYGYKVRLWNSGSVPLKTLAVQFAFASTATNFKVFNVTHDTNPKKEFGKIEESGSDAFSKRFVYELLNQKDEDVLTFLSNLDALLSVHAKAEDLKVQFVEAKSEAAQRKLDQYVLIMLGTLSSLFTVVMFWILERRRRYLWEKLKERRHPDVTLPT